MNHPRTLVALKVKVRYFTTLRELARTREEELEMEDGSTLAELIERVASKYGGEAFNYLHVRATGEIDPSIQFLINGISARDLHGLRTELREGDVVAVIPPVGGG